MSRLLGLIQNFQKLDYMNLNIVGSPTINNGVVSGFSNSDYLQLPNINTLSTFEIKMKFKITTNSSSYMNIVSSYYNWGLQGFQVKNDTLQAKLRYNYEGTSTTKTITQSYNFQENIDYYVKYVFKNNEFYVAISIDDITYIYSSVENIPNGATLSLPIISGIGQLSIGNTYQYSAFQGEIDINNSYIVINGTKYLFRLPNTIDLIKVGNPTINGTIISGFSSNDYLKISNTNFSFDRNIDLYFKIHTDQINQAQYIFSSTQKPVTAVYDCGIELVANNKYGFNSIRKNNYQLVQTADLTFNDDTDIYFHFSWNYNTKLFRFGYSYDGTTYNYPISINDGYSYYPLISDIIIGCLFDGTFVFLGSIDLDETKTYAIIDNKKYTFKLL